MTYTTNHLDYLLGLAPAQPALPRQGTVTLAPPDRRRLWRITGVGHPPEDGHRPPRPGDVHEELLFGLYGNRIPVAMSVFNAGQGVAVHVGTWSPAGRESVAAATLDARQAVLGGVLTGLLPSVDWQPAQEPPRQWELGGVVLGAPAPRRTTDGAVPWDRLLRAMAGTRWACLILAEPVEAAFLAGLRHVLLNEQRQLAAAAKAERADSPLAQQCQEQVRRLLEAMTLGHAVGAWRTAVYLLGDAGGYHRLSSVWPSVFAGPKALPEALRVHDDPGAPDLAAAWAMPDLEGPPPPGLYQRPFLHQSLLNSRQLAQMLHLPQKETAGFEVRHTPEFDVVPPDCPAQASVSLGQVLERSGDSGLPYRISLDDLNRHALVVGVTGSGKTNTVFHLIKQLWAQRKPFLVLEPAKAEYRALLSKEGLGGQFRVFTAGDENTSPLRLNPLEVPPDCSVATHIDLLKSVFNASFGMWTPLPQVLERCLHEVYRDRGWDPVRGDNRRLKPEPRDEAVRALAYPTLGELQLKVEEVVEGLGYDDRVASDIKAALVTRLAGLRIGGKGVMLDCRRSLPMEELLAGPTVIELEPVGDDDEKAFIMGLLLLRLYEHLRAKGPVDVNGEPAVGAEVQSAGERLSHVMVIEEAHRLLAAAPAQADQDQANVRGKAVETFVNMLSEVRAYGQGFVVAEQIPSKLSVDVIKNTNLKVVHRTVAAEDRRLMAGAMNMTQAQGDMLAVLRKGETAMFAMGDDRPVLVQVPPAKVEGPQGMKHKRTGDQLVRQAMAAWRARPEVAKVLEPPAECLQHCLGPGQDRDQAGRHCDESRRLLEEPKLRLRFASLLLTLTEAPDQTGRALGLLRQAAAMHSRAGLGREALSCLLQNALEMHLSRLGRLAGWGYAAEAKVKAAALPVLMALPRQGGETGQAWADALARLRQAVHEASERGFDPFDACGSICPDGLCLYRHYAGLLVGESSLAEKFSAALTQAAGPDGWTDWRAMDEVARQLLPDEKPHSAEAAKARRGLMLCYGAQRIVREPDMLPSSIKNAQEFMVADYDRRCTPGAPAMAQGAPEEWDA